MQYNVYSIAIIGLMLPLSVMLLPSPKGMWMWRPSFIVLFFSFLALVSGHALFDLTTISETTVYLFVFSGISFFLGDFLSTAFNGHFLSKNFSEYSLINLPSKRLLHSIYSAFGIIGLLIAMYLFVKRGFLSGDAIGFALRYAHMYGEEPEYGAFHFIMIGQTLGTLLILSSNRKKVRYGFILLLISIFGSIVKMERTSLLLVLASIAFILHYKSRKISTIAYPAVISAVFFYAIANLTFKSETAAGNFATAYLGYGLKAFDDYILKLPGVDYGANVFPWLSKIIQNGSTKYEIDIAAGEFNTFTYIQAPYMDFGFFGALIVVFFFAFLWGIVFNGIRTSSFNVLLYSFMIYPTIMVFYGWQFSLTSIFYYIFLYYILCKAKVIYRKRKIE